MEVLVRLAKIDVEVVVDPGGEKSGSDEGSERVTDFDDGSRLDLWTGIDVEDAGDHSSDRIRCSTLDEQQVIGVDGVGLRRGGDGHRVENRAGHWTRGDSGSPPGSGVGIEVDRTASFVRPIWRIVH